MLAKRAAPEITTHAQTQMRKLMRTPALSQSALSSRALLPAECSPTHLSTRPHQADHPHQADIPQQAVCPHLYTRTQSTYPTTSSAPLGSRANDRGAWWHKWAATRRRVGRHAHTLTVRSSLAVATKSLHIAKLHNRAHGETETTGCMKRVQRRTHGEFANHVHGKSAKQGAL